MMEKHFACQKTNTILSEQYMGIPKGNTATLCQYTNNMDIGTDMMVKHTACQIKPTLMPTQNTGIPKYSTAILGQYKHIMSIPMAMMENTPISKHNAPHCQS